MTKSGLVHGCPDFCDRKNQSQKYLQPVYMRQTKFVAKFGTDLSHFATEKSVTSTQFSSSECYGYGVGVSYVRS